MVAENIHPATRPVNNWLTLLQCACTAPTLQHCDPVTGMVHSPFQLAALSANAPALHTPRTHATHTRHTLQIGRVLGAGVVLEPLLLRLSTPCLLLGLEDAAEEAPEKLIL